VSTPAGFTLYARPSRYLDLIRPLYEAVGDPAVAGLRIDERHTNARGFVHAGVLVAVADVLMGHTAHRASPPGTGLVTASLTSDFPGSAQLRDWVTGAATLRRIGRKLDHEKAVEDATTTYYEAQDARDTAMAALEDADTARGAAVQSLLDLGEPPARIAVLVGLSVAEVRKLRRTTTTADDNDNDKSPEQDAAATDDAAGPSALAS